MIQQQSKFEELWLSGFRIVTDSSPTKEPFLGCHLFALNPWAMVCAVRAATLNGKAKKCGS